jgi:hypothetical protein
MRNAYKTSWKSKWEEQPAESEAYNKMGLEKVKA